MGYIGRDEQKEDWPNHKKVCKALRAARGDAEHWLCRRTPSEMRQALLNESSGDAAQFVADITDFPRLCVVCRQGSSQERLKDCADCFGVAVCGGGKHSEEELAAAHGQETCQVNISRTNYILVSLLISTFRRCASVPKITGMR